MVRVAIVIAAVVAVAIVAGGVVDARRKTCLPDGGLPSLAGEIVVRGKGPRLDHVPLLADVGEAVARHLHTDRGTRSR